MNKQSITLTQKERDIIIIQLGARITKFEELMFEAAKIKDTNRVIEITENIKTLKDIQKKLML